MSGHSHWSKVKRYKGVADARRSKVWSKLARKIIVAAKHGGGNPDDNLSLRYAIDEARAENMPNDTIDKAIKKGTGALGVAEYESIMYEGYGPAGVAFMVDVLTDNRARTAPELRKIFERAGGQLGATNCVAWMFEKKGTFVIAVDKASEDALMELALEAGADDVTKDEEIFEITCQIPAFITVKNALAQNNIETISAAIGMTPKTTVQVGADKSQQVMNLLDALEDHEDVQNVYANFDMPEELMTGGK